MFNDKLLADREKRSKIIKKDAQNSDVVSIKANVVGADKNIPLATLTTKYFAKLVLNGGVKGLKRLYSADGLTILGKISDGKSFKNYAVNLEETHPLGRLIDIDVTLKGQTQSLSRGSLRKCFLCDNPAFVCGKNKTHTVGELFDFFNNTSKTYFSNLIANIIKESMIEELNIEDKFGLVTKTSNGSHKDMDYDCMLNAVEVIKDSLGEAFFVGLKTKDVNLIMERLIPIGVLCEEKMLKATNGANAYKGFIFAGGILLASIGYVLNNRLCYSDVYKISAKIFSTYNAPTNTFGYESYKKGFGGIRKEAKSGFITVKKAQTLLSKKPLWKVLTYILSEIDDSVLLKRAGSLKRYEYFKNLIINSQSKNKTLITNECIKNNVSIGGSADILICALFIDKIKKTFIF